MQAKRENTSFVQIVYPCIAFGGGVAGAYKPLGRGGLLTGSFVTIVTDPTVLNPFIYKR